MANRDKVLEPFRLQVIQAKVQAADAAVALKKSQDQNEDAQRILALAEAQLAAVEVAIPKEEANAEHVGA